jgi:hypothetical protein
VSPPSRSASSASGSGTIRRRGTGRGSGAQTSDGTHLVADEELVQKVLERVLDELDRRGRRGPGVL